MSFSKLVNLLAPGTIPTRAIQEDTSDPRRGRFRMLENQSEVLRAARRLHCSIVSMAPSDLVEGKNNLIYGLLWQIVKNGILVRAEGSLLPSLRPSRSQSNLGGEASPSFAEGSLLRWVNQTLNLAEEDRLTNLGKGLSDGRIYIRLLQAVFAFPQPDSDAPLSLLPQDSQESGERATIVCKVGREILGNRCILVPEDIVEGNEAMNVLFLASLCQKAAENLAAAAAVTTASAADRTSALLAEDQVALKERIRELEAERDALLLSLAEYKRQESQEVDLHSTHDDPQSSNVILSLSEDDSLGTSECGMTDVGELSLEFSSPKTGDEPPPPLTALGEKIQPALALFLQRWQESNGGDQHEALCHLESRLGSGAPIFSKSQPIFDREASTEALDIPVTEIAARAEAEELLRSSQAAATAYREQAEQALAMHAQDSSRLRQIYHYTKNLIPLLKVIYCSDLAAEQLLSGSCACDGLVMKRSIRSAAWNRRRAILRDNFLFFFREGDERKPTSVEKLDDALVSRTDEFSSRIKGPVMCVEICSAVNAHHLYLATEDAETLQNWENAIRRASSWWTNRTTDSRSVTAPRPSGEKVAE